MRALLIYLMLIVVPAPLVWAADEVVVSDIDDTLKAAHVLDRWDAIWNGPNDELVFRGMPELLRGIANSRPGARFFYVSNAPADLMEGSHTRFLRKAEFPAGELSLRTSMGDTDFKWRKMNEIIEKEKPKRLLLIGDNGERDIEIYAEIAQHHPEIEVTIFIHQVYSVLSEDETGRSLGVGQFGFVTSMDAAPPLLSLQWINEAEWNRQLDLVADLTVSRLLSEASSANAFWPEWVDCRDLRPVWTPVDPRLVELRSILQARCGGLGEALPLAAGEGFVAP